MSIVYENSIITSIVGEINSKFSKNLVLVPLSTRAPKPAAGSHQPDEKAHFILVGASHASRLTSQLAESGASAEIVSLPGWRPTASTAEKAAGELSEAISRAPKDSTVVFQFLDSAAYYARTEEGGLVPARRNHVDNSYHIDGELVMAPSEVFLHTLKTSLPIFQAASGCPKLLLAPLPRYLVQGCCPDKDHIPNRSEEGYEDLIFTGVDNLRRQCKNFLHMNKVTDCITLNTAQLICSTSGARTTPENVRGELKMSWGPDPVHASVDCYTRLAKNIRTLCEERAALAKTADRRPNLEGASKRPRWIVSGEVDGGVFPSSGLSQPSRGGRVSAPYYGGPPGQRGQRARGYSGRRPRGGRRGW